MFSKLVVRCAFYISTRPTIPCRPLHITKRTLSSITHHDEIVTLPVGGNGTVNLTISRPIQPATNNDVLVYLPPGPEPFSSKPSAGLITPRNLRQTFPTTTIVDVQYRISLLDAPSPKPDTNSNSSLNGKSRKETSKGEASETDKADHRFPTPIHDVFTAWSFITDELRLYNHRTDINGAENEENTVYYPPRVCIVGSHIGGALALSLALTEPEGIHGVAVVDGVVDWVGFDELATTKSIAGVERGSTSGLEEGVADSEEDEEQETGSLPPPPPPPPPPADATQKEKGNNVNRRNATLLRLAVKEKETTRLRLAARELIEVRRRLFRSHSGYFDAFASPMLFLRAPGRDTPVEGMVDMGSHGEVMRYGDGIEEVAVVVGREGEGEFDGDRGSRNGEAFGPYDDDWHSHSGSNVSEDEAREKRKIMNSGNDAALLRAMGGLTFERNETEHGSHEAASNSDTATGQSSSSSSASQNTTSDMVSSTSSPSQTPTTSPSISSPHIPPSEQTQPQPRRRKVLRRWPPTGHPEGTILPPITVFTTIQTTTADNRPDLSPLLKLQAAEMTELLRKACFWGRERGIAEERVKLIKIGQRQDIEDWVGGERGRDSEKDAEEIIAWLCRRFDGDGDGNGHMHD